MNDAVGGAVRVVPAEWPINALSPAVEDTEGIGCCTEGAKSAVEDTEADPLEPGL